MCITCEPGGEPFDLDPFFEPVLLVRVKLPLPSVPRLALLVLLAREKSSFLAVGNVVDKTPSERAR